MEEMTFDNWKRQLRAICVAAYGSEPMDDPFDHGGDEDLDIIQSAMEECPHGAELVTALELDKRRALPWVDGEASLPAWLHRQRDASQQSNLRVALGFLHVQKKEGTWEAVCGYNGLKVNCIGFPDAFQAVCALERILGRTKYDVLFAPKEVPDAPAV